MMPKSILSFANKLYVSEHYSLAKILYSQIKQDNELLQKSIELNINNCNLKLSSRKQTMHKTVPNSSVRQGGVFVHCTLGNKEVIHDILANTCNNIYDGGVEVTLIGDERTLSYLNKGKRFKEIRCHFCLSLNKCPRVNEENYSQKIINAFIEIEKQWLKNTNRNYNENLRQNIINSLTFWEKTFEEKSPEHILIWGSTSPLSQALKYLAIKNNSTFNILERGLINGSLTIDNKGQFGTSLANTSIYNRSCTRDNFDLVDKIIEYSESMAELPYSFAQGGIAVDKDSTIKKLLIIGSSDTGCGISFDIETFNMKHAGYYYSTLSAVKDILKAASRLDKNIKIILKPHPSDKSNYEIFKDDYNFEIVRNKNIVNLIESSDVVCALCTTAITNAIFQKKPILLLAFADIAGKGIAYEAQYPDQLLIQMQYAMERRNIEEKLTNANNYLEHIIKNRIIFAEKICDESLCVTDLSSFILENIYKSRKIILKKEKSEGLIFPENKYRVFQSNDDTKISRMANVDILVPVYRDVDLTCRVVEYAIKSSNYATNTQIIIINDQSPDLGMDAALLKLAEKNRNRITYLTNHKNLGFVGTVNRGIDASRASADILLLNSDCIIPEKMVSKLRNAAYADHKIATVTPLSNDAGLMSIDLNLDKEQLLNLEPRIEKFDCLAATLNPSFTLELPTGHGSCLYVKRTHLSRIGYLNELSFQHGYSEEIDFCQRARHIGFVNVGLMSTFSLHIGGVSFNSIDVQLNQRVKNRTIIKNLYPNYFSEINKFITFNPISSLTSDFIHNIASQP